jgi:hypothetical protein
MKTIEEAAQEYANNVCTIGSDIRGIESKDINDYLQDAIYNGVEYAQQWIDVNDELPNEKNGYFDRQVLVKRFSDFDRTEIEYTVTKYNKRGWEEYSRITHWRPIELK